MFGLTRGLRTVVVDRQGDVAKIPYQINPHGLHRKVYKVIHIGITMSQTLPPKNILHYPQLDTVLMVEEFIRDNPGEYKKKSLWQHLPRRMIYQTYCVIYDYLLESQKIAVDKEGHICWIWNQGLVKRYLSKPHLRWKK